MELVKQTSAELIFSGCSYIGNSIEINVKSTEDKDGITKLHCSVVQRLSSDEIYSDIMADDVAIKFIVDMYLNTESLWKTSEDGPKYLTAIRDFRVELEDIPEIELGDVGTRLPAALDPYKLYRDKRKKVFGANLFSNIEVELKIV
jgi:hypothetical protein